MPFPALPALPILPSLWATLGGYLGLKTAGTAAVASAEALGVGLATYIGPPLLAGATKVAQTTFIYFGGKLISWSCDDAVEFIKKNCDYNYTWYDSGCVAMKGKEFTACYGAWVANGALIYDLSTYFFDAIKKKES